MARIEHAGAAPETTLAAPIGSGDLSLVADDLSGYPTGAVGAFYIVIDPGTSSTEKILLSSRSGNNATVAAGGRGADDTVAVPHLAGAVIQHVFTAIEADEANAHIEADSGVHGTSTQIVGVDDTQTLTNKLISGASNTFSNIPLSAVLFAAGWESALGAILGTNWADAFDTALGSNWTTAFANALGATWTDALDTALGAGWPGQLSQAITSALVQADATQTLTNKTITSDDNTLDIGLSSLQRAILVKEGNGGSPAVDPNSTRSMTTQTTKVDIGGFGHAGFTSEFQLPVTGLWLFIATGEFSHSSAVNAGMQLRSGGTPGEPTSGTSIAFSHVAIDGPRLNQTIHACVVLSAGTNIAWNVVNFGSSGNVTIHNDRSHLTVIYQGPAS